MSITLGGVTLNDEMIWTDRDTYSEVKQSIKHTLQGRPLLYGQVLNQRYITLKATKNHGWLTKTTVDSLRGLAAGVNASYTLTIAVRSMTPENYTVVFRHFEPPALSMTPFVFRHDQDSGEYYSGTIKLMTVS